MLISLPLRQRPSSAWTGQVSLGWTKGSAFGIRQEAKPPGPKFAKRRSRETEPSSRDASAPQAVFGERNKRTAFPVYAPDVPSVHVSTEDCGPADPQSSGGGAGISHRVGQNLGSSPF